MADLPQTPADLVETFTRVRDEFKRLMLAYRFGMDEIRTKLEILREEFVLLHDDNPIEHISTRLKTPESVLDKATRKGLEPSMDNLRAITDIAGARVICSFTSDAYRVFDALTEQPDLQIREVKDYIATPKPNGYRSLHTIVLVPVFFSSGPVQVPVEVQFRTVAMDFWASLEHKIYYKYRGAVPDEVVRRLSEAADTAARLDAEMEDLHAMVHGRRGADATPAPQAAVSDAVVRRLIQGLAEPPGA